MEGPNRIQYYEHSCDLVWIKKYCKYNIGSVSTLIQNIEFIFGVKKLKKKCNFF